MDWYLERVPGLAFVCSCVWDTCLPYGGVCVFVVVIPDTGV